MKTNRGTLLFKAVVCISVGLGLAFFVYSITSNWDDWTSMAQVLEGAISWENSGLLALCLLLMPLNWILEAIKWKTLTTTIQKLSIVQALEGVMMGVSVSILTPNRIGEYLGRVLSLEPARRWQGVTAQALGSLLQIVVLCILGTMGMFHLVGEQGLIAPLSRWHLTIMAAVIIVALLLLRHRALWLNILRRIIPDRYVQKIEQMLIFVDGYTFHQIIKILFLVVIRIAIYVLQYHLLLSFFGVKIDFVLASAAILTTYLFQSILPVPMLLGLIARGEITLLVWNLFDVNELAVLSSSYLLWVINVLLPALVGAGVMIRSNARKIVKEG